MSLQPQLLVTPPSNLHDPILSAINKYENHCSIIAIKRIVQNLSYKFNFTPVQYADVFHTILKLNSSKKTGGTIPISVLKKHIHAGMSYY